ncbi:MAG: hypothetical protein QM791_04220 [Ferruginibacter sp.]
MDYKTEAEMLVGSFLTEVPFREGKPYPNTEDAKINAVIAVNWYRKKLAGERHQKHCDELIEEIKSIS